MNQANQIVFRLCKASDGRVFAFLSDQPYVEDIFDNGYKVAYKHRDASNGSELLARWRSSYMVKSAEFEKIPEDVQLPEEFQQDFNNMMFSMIKGVDVFFCDYNLAIQANLPICNDAMESYRSTDFVLFSCEELIGNDPSTQPYMVSYAMPRYPNTKNTAQQHRIYCKTDAFAFCQSVHAIVIQQEKDALTGGHIRTELDPYIDEPTIEESAAQQLIDQLVESIPSFSKPEEPKMLAASGAEEGYAENEAAAT